MKEQQANNECKHKQWQEVKRRKTEVRDKQASKQAAQQTRNLREKKEAKIRSFQGPGTAC